MGGEDWEALMSRSNFGYRPTFTSLSLAALEDFDSAATLYDGSVPVWASSALEWVPTVLYSSPKSNFASSSNPSTGNDSSQGYSVGSLWVNTTTDTAFVCLDASTGAAIWSQVDVDGPKSKYDGSDAPAADSDSTDGYGIGSIWIDAANDRAYICLDPTEGAAVWKRVDPDAPKSVYSATAAPLVSNDTTEGYGVGSVWADTTNDRAYICLDSAEGAAVWKEITPTATIDGLVAQVETLSDQVSAMAGTLISLSATVTTLSTPKSYIYVRYSSTVGAGNGTDLIPDVTLATRGSNISYNSSTGVFTLAADKEYVLTATVWGYITGGSTSPSIQGWVNSATNAYISGAAGNAQNEASTTVYGMAPTTVWENNQPTSISLHKTTGGGVTTIKYRKVAGAGFNYYLLHLSVVEV